MALEMLAAPDFLSSLQRIESLGHLHSLDKPKQLGLHGLRYHIGVWGKDAEDESSNYRELRNVVKTLEDAEVNGDLCGAQVFFCTDNSMAEAAIYKGTSSSPIL